MNTNFCFVCYDLKLRIKSYDNLTGNCKKKKKLDEIED